MPKYKVVIPVETFRRNSEQSTSEVKLPEEVKLDEDFILKPKEEGMDAVVWIEAENENKAKAEALDFARKFFGFLGFDIKFGLIIKDGFVYATEERKPEIKSVSEGQTKALAEEIHPQDSLHITLTKSPDTFRRAYEMFKNLNTEDESLFSALDLYNASFFERSERSRFLTLMVILEVLAPERKDIDALVDVFSKIKREAKRITEGFDGEVKNKFLTELGKLKKESITQTLQNLVRPVQREGEDLEDIVTKLYGIRGKLTHKGKKMGNLNSKVNELRDIVERVIESKLPAYQVDAP